MWILDNGEYRLSSRRVNIFPCNIREKAISFLSNRAKIQGISRSKVLEQILTYMLSNEKRISVRLFSHNGTTRKSSNSRGREPVYVKCPKFYLLPKVISDFKRNAKKRKSSYTVYLDEIILSYIYNFQIPKYTIDEMTVEDEKFSIVEEDKNERFFMFLGNVGGMRDRAIDDVRQQIKGY